MIRQTRDNFDARLVLEFLKGCPAKGQPPQQGWISLAEEACRRILLLEARMTAIAAATRSLHLGTEGLIEMSHIGWEDKP